MSSDSSLRVTEFPSVTKAMGHCLTEVAKRLRVEKPAHPVAIFDLDETVLKYYNTGEGTPRETERVRSFPNMKANIEFLQRQGVEVVFLTARRERARRSTMRTLRGLGLTEFRLFMKPDDAPSKSSSVKKWERRATLVEDEGVTIVLNVGDQLSDHLHHHDWPAFFKDVLGSASVRTTAPRLVTSVADVVRLHKHRVRATDLAEEALPRVRETLVLENAEWIDDDGHDVPTWFGVKMPSGFTTH